MAHQLPDAFVDAKKVVKSHIPAVNAPARIDLPNEHISETAEGAKQRLKRGRLIGAKDTVPRKRKVQGKAQKDIMLQ